MKTHFSKCTTFHSPFDVTNIQQSPGHSVRTAAICCNYLKLAAELFKDSYQKLAFVHPGTGSIAGVLHEYAYKISVQITNW